MTSSQNRHNATATQGAETSSSSVSNSYRNKPDSDVQQARSITRHTEEAVDQIQDALAILLSTLDQVKVENEQFQAGVLTALSQICARLDFIDIHLGIKSAPVPVPVEDLGNSADKIPTSTRTLIIPGGKSEFAPGIVSIPTTSHCIKPVTPESGPSVKNMGAAAGVRSSTAALRDKWLAMKSSSKMVTSVKPTFDSTSEEKEIVAVKLQKLNPVPVPIQAQTTTSSSNSATLTAAAIDTEDERKANNAPKMFDPVLNNVHPQSVMGSTHCSTFDSLPNSDRSVKIFKLPRMVKPSAKTAQSVSPIMTYLDASKTAIEKLLVTRNLSVFAETSAAVVQLLPGLKETNTLNEFLNFIFETFSKDPKLANIGGRLCKNTSGHPTCGTEFRNLLIYRSQQEFNNVMQRLQSIAKGTDCDVETRTQGLIYFMAALYLNVLVNTKVQRNPILVLATIELMQNLLALSGACHHTWNIHCIVNVLTLLKWFLITDGVEDKRILAELEKLGKQCSRLESSGDSSMIAEIKKTLLFTCLQIKLKRLSVSKD